MKSQTLYRYIRILKVHGKLQQLSYARSTPDNEIWTMASMARAIL
jgi:hypothetical protein